MSDDIVKTLLESLTQEQKDQLVQGLLNSNTKSDTPVTENKSEQLEKNSPNRSVNEDFTVTSNNLEQRKSVVRARKNQWVDDGEFRDEDVDYQKFEKMKTPRRRGKPNKRQVECHVCGKTFSINESLIYGEFIRCNKCTGR
tara:strand:- start:4259 stop:4681 length:423 start_codon:yes stop_codon:yes gene_type:complete